MPTETKTKTKAKACKKKPVTLLTLAKDVIKIMDTPALMKVLDVQQGNYLEYGGVNNALAKRMDKGPVELQEILNTPRLRTWLKCKVCARGMLVVAKALRLDNLPLSDLSQGDTTKQLDGIATDEQLSLIECAFEKTGQFDSYSEDASRAVDFGLEYDLCADRLRAIMNNIVNNKGTFRP